MVETLADAQKSKGQVGIIVGNPTVTRGHRVNVTSTADGEYLMYGNKTNFILRHFAEPATKSMVFAAIHKDDVSCVTERPNHDK
jgi:hypothetical protein